MTSVRSHENFVFVERCFHDWTWGFQLLRLHFKKSKSNFCLFLPRFLHSSGEGFSFQSVNMFRVEANQLIYKENQRDGFCMMAFALSGGDKSERSSHVFLLPQCKLDIHCQFFPYLQFHEAVQLLSSFEFGKIFSSVTHLRTSLGCTRFISWLKNWWCHWNLSSRAH